MHSTTFSKWNNLKETILNEKYSSDKVKILTKEELKHIIIEEKIIEKN
jgi:hypothetical protein